MPGTVAIDGAAAGLVCASAAIARSESNHAAPTKMENEEGRRDDTFTEFPWRNGSLTRREAKAKVSAALHGAFDFIHRFRDDSIDAEAAELSA